jgi:hypothetical protein
MPPIEGLLAFITIIGALLGVSGAIIALHRRRKIETQELLLLRKVSEWQTINPLAGLVKRFDELEAKGRPETYTPEQQAEFRSLLIDISQTVQDAYKAIDSVAANIQALKETHDDIDSLPWYVALQQVLSQFRRNLADLEEKRARMFRRLPDARPPPSAVFLPPNK